MKRVEKRAKRPAGPTGERSQRFPAACTVISRNNLSFARVLASSYLQHHPGARFYLLVVDKLPDGLDAGPGIQLLDPGELYLPYFAELCFRFTAAGLCSALKPALLTLLFGRYHEEQLIYFDADTLVMRRLDELMACLASATIVLTPHSLKPAPLDGLRPDEPEILNAGVYNAGLIALRQSDETHRFLRWWQARLRDCSLVEYYEGLFIDQRWLDLARALFDTTTFKDETYGVSYLNIGTRPIEKCSKTFCINGRPLAALHFRGVDPANPDAFSKYQTRIEVANGTAIADLIYLYVKSQVASGFATAHQWRYAYDSFDNGIFIHPVCRQLYTALDPRKRVALGDPFHAAAENSFFAWATRSDPAENGLSPFLNHIYNTRPDVRAEFPDIEGKDRSAFLHWAYATGAAELGYDPDAMLVSGSARSPIISASCFDNGVPVNEPIRRLYATLDPHERDGFGDPLCTAGEGSFFAWATRGDSESQALSPFLKSVCELRPDVLASFPDVDGKDRAAFLRWAYKEGAAELGYDPDAMRVYGDAGRPNSELFLADSTHLDPGHAPPRPKCSVIIPVYNKASLTRNCLDSLLSMASRKDDFEIIVVDDASSDDTVALLNSYGGRIRVVSHEVNRGFSASCNDGAAVASGEYLIFLNNDTISQPGWLDALIGYADNHPSAAVVGSKLLFPDDTIQHAGMVMCEDREPRHIYTGFPADHPLVNKSRRFQVVTGGCFLIRREDFHQAKGFDLGFRNGYEDVDLCLRLGELGREIHYCHESVLYHLEAVSRDVKAEEAPNRDLYRGRWAERVRPDEFDYYFEDGLLKVDYRPLYPIGLSISPLLAVSNEVDRECEVDRLLAVRSRQVLGLLKDNIRLSVRAQEAELRVGSLNGSSEPRPQRHSLKPLSSPKIVCSGYIQRLSNHSSNRIVSIILPVKNGAPKLRELLPAIIGQNTRDPIEIIAVDSASEDESIDLLRRFNATVISIDPRSFNHGLTRNLATQYARGHIFVFLNQSTMPADEKWLPNLIAPFDRDPEVAAVCGRVLPRTDADLLTARDIARNINAAAERIVTSISDWDYYRSLKREELRRFVNFHTLSAAIRAEVFRKVPFRDANFGEDLIWGKEALEAGFRIQFEPSSVAFHSHNYSVLDILRRNVDDGAACRKIVGRTLEESIVVPDLVGQILNDWRYLENECHLLPQALEEWRLTSAMRRTAQYIGQWAGVNFESAGGLLPMLSIVEQIKAGARTEAPEAWEARNAHIAG